MSISQENVSCSLVLKVKKRDALYFQVLTGAVHTVYHESSALFKKCTRYFFQRDTSSESNCNRSFRGHPSGLTIECSTPLHLTRNLTLEIGL